MKKITAATLSHRDRNGRPQDPAHSEFPALLSEVLANTGAGTLTGARIGTLVGFTRSGQCLVNFAENTCRAAVPARTVFALEAVKPGSEVVLLFEREDPRKPIVMGVLQPARKPGANPRKSLLPSDSPQVEIDGETLTLSARSQIVLRCGESSITLTRAGKVLINGAYVVSRSSGVNKIKGGSIQLN